MFLKPQRNKQTDTGQETNGSDEGDAIKEVCMNDYPGNLIAANRSLKFCDITFVKSRPPRPRIACVSPRTSSLAASVRDSISDIGPLLTPLGSRWLGGGVRFADFPLRNCKGTGHLQVSSVEFGAEYSFDNYNQKWCRFYLARDSNSTFRCEKPMTSVIF